MEVVERSGNAWEHFSLQSVLSCETEIEEIALLLKRWVPLDSEEPIRTVLFPNMTEQTPVLLFSIL